MANQPAPPLVILRSPLVDKDGMLTLEGIKQFQIWATQLQNGLDQIGNFIGNLDPTVQIVSKPGTIGTITQNLNAAGVVTGGGVDFALPYLNKNTDHIADGSGSPLAGGKIAFVALANPLTGKVLEWDGANWQWVARAQTKALVASQFFASFDEATGLFGTAQPAFTDISGTATAGQIPAISTLSGQITTTQLPASGLSATVALAKLTTLGADGSATYTNGILTAYVPPT